MSANTLSSVQFYALFDVLTHHEVYEEIKDLKYQPTITHFGPPLQTNSSEEPSSPLIQILLKRFALVLPGLRDVSPDFWHRRMETLFNALAQADLSESYDKGSIGIRRTLATATAAVIEYCARGSLGKYPNKESIKGRSYDTSDPHDVSIAWEHFLQQIVYGDLIDRMFAKAATTDQLDHHEPLVQATHEYIFVM